MNKQVQEAAQAATMEIDTLQELPQLPDNQPLAIIEPAEDATSEDAIDPERLADLQQQIDLTDTVSIMHFGSKAQTELTVISQEMLSGVKSKDAGPAGDSLRDMVTAIRGFSAEQGDMRAKASWWERLLGRAAPFANFVSRYETVQNQIDTITDNLLQHEHTLMKDVHFLDRLYEKTLEFYRELGLYIVAGEALIDRMDALDIPEAQEAAENASENEAMMKAQALRDLRSARDGLERRVHDLKLTRQVTMQALPSMRLVQENDKSLILKINSTLVNTVPLWETQLAQAITIQRSSEAAKAVRASNDLTNDLLTANAANLRDANKVVRQEMERGIFDIEAVKAANADLVATIEESLQIADEGKRARAAAESDLQKMEGDLKTTLAKASSRS